jgi:SAM-dependent methyltransferase
LAISKAIIEKANPEAQLWDREYGSLKVIPSSTRALPSKALVLFSEILDFKSMRDVLDAGCGIGRNSTYLAQKGCNVHAVDYSDTALKVLDNAAIKLGVREKIRTYNCKLGETFPFETNAFDLVLDSYVFCHFTDDGIRQNYRKELNRVTRPGGIVFSSIFSFEDQYYKKILEKGGGKHNLVTDPNNGITKRLYTEQEIRDFFSIDFEILYSIKFEFDDIVLAKTYRRSILALALRK